MHGRLMMKEREVIIEAILLCSEIEIENLETEEEWNDWLFRKSHKWEKDLKARFSRMDIEKVESELLELD